MIPRKTFWFALGALGSFVSFFLVLNWFWAEKSGKAGVTVAASISAFIWFVIKTDWRALVRDQATLDRQREHDTELFKRLDEIMAEWRVNQINESVSGTQKMWDQDFRACGDLEAWVEQEGNHFIDPQLRSRLLAFTGAVNAVHWYALHHFFPTNGDFNRLYPHLEERMEFNDQSAWQEWNRHTAKLNELCLTMRGTYSALRTEVKRRLSC